MNLIRKLIELMNNVTPRLVILNALKWRLSQCMLT